MEQGIADLYVGITNDSASALSANDIRHIETPQELTIKPKVNTDSAYAGNRKVDSATAFDSADITLSAYDLTAAMHAYLLNASSPAEGGVAESAEDEGNFLAVFYKTPLRRKKNGSARVTRYGWLYKTQFQPYDTTMKTLQGKPDLSNSPSLTGSAQPTDFSFVDESGVTRHPWRWFVDDDDPNCPADIATSWCQYLHVPGADTSALTATTTPATGATGVTAGASVVWTFSKAIAAACVNAGNFVMLKADGTAVTGALTLDSTGKIVTFKPSANLTSGAVYIAMAGMGITDAFGLSMASAKIITFTVA